MSEQILKKEKVFIQPDVENKQVKEQSEKLRSEENEKLRNEEKEKLRNENEQLRKVNEQLWKNNIVKDANIKELIEKPIEIKSPEEDKNTTDFYPNWFDKNKFKNVLAIINSNKFSYRHKIGEFKYIDIKDIIILKKNKISEISAKKGLKTLNELKNIEIIKQEKRTPKQKELLNLFNDLSDTVLTDETLESKSQEEENESKNENDNKNENDKT